MAFEEGPVEVGDGTIRLRIEPTIGTEVAHPVDVGGTGDVRLGGHQRTHAVASHAQHVRLHHPVIGVEVGDPEPVGELARRDVEQGGDVGQHHQARDVVAPCLAPHPLDNPIEALESGRPARPECGRQWSLGAEH